MRLATSVFSTIRTAAGGSRLQPGAAGSFFQRRHLSDSLRAAIGTAVRSAPVVLFMKGTPAAPQCGFSRAAIAVLANEGVDPAKFAAYDVLPDPDLRDGIKAFSDWATIPQLYVAGEFVGGCDILVQMHKEGELAELLRENDVLVRTAPVVEAKPREGTEGESK